MPEGAGPRRRHVLRRLLSVGTDADDVVAAAPPLPPRDWPGVLFLLVWAIVRIAL
ncbi:hypothetical protein ACFY20_09255 [Streptomyces sp. NPDC001312]|uniref:hypothetical protein n=1 Tax=Streptomyces sp. NPDC001312 TaxID=3364561 RepID=UPI003680C766